MVHHVFKAAHSLQGVVVVLSSAEGAMLPPPMVRAGWPADPVAAVSESPPLSCEDSAGVAGG